MYYIYVLRSKIKSWYYIGHTDDIERRLSEHNRGKNRSTSPYRPFEVVYSEVYQTKGEAFRREQQIKRYRHGEAFKKLIIT